jgi:excisionase family DNA binding protein
VSAIDSLPQKALLTVKEVAKVFGVTNITVYTWIEAGKLLACNPSGGCLRIFRESVIELINKSITLKR